LPAWRADSASICATTCSQPSATTSTAPTFGCRQYAASVSWVICMSGRAAAPGEVRQRHTIRHARAMRSVTTAEHTTVGTIEHVIANADAPVRAPDSLRIRDACSSHRSSRRQSPRPRPLATLCVVHVRAGFDVGRRRADRTAVLHDALAADPLQARSCGRWRSVRARDATPPASIVARAPSGSSAVATLSRA
jgi:hypothetical protein